jgi:DNA-binding beta-propeller fold protein YncE
VAVTLVTTVVAVVLVLVTNRESRVGEAPPLTVLQPEGSASGEPGTIGPDEIDTADPAEPPAPTDVKGRWRVAREFRVGDFHPLDIAFNPVGASLYVSGDDASLREYRLKTGELIHKASVPAQGDHIRVLFDRYVAVLRHEDAARIPVMDTKAWDRDPVLLDVGRSPGDIVELPDGRSVVAATVDSKRVTRFELPSGARMANITLPHATGQLYVVHANGRPHIGALGALTHAGRPAGAWIDLFEPEETPFGATRRSVAVGRDPRAGAVTSDGGALFFPDRVSNTAVLLSVSGVTRSQQVAVSGGPTAGFLMEGDRYGVTLNTDARTASVIDLGTMAVLSTLPLRGVPCAGVTSPDKKTLFVALGGEERPPTGSGVDVIAGDPPKVVASLPTGKGACAVAVSKDGTRAAVASYHERSIVVLER